MATAARQRGQVVREVAAVADGTFGDEPGDSEEDLVREGGE